MLNPLLRVSFNVSIIGLIDGIEINPKNSAPKAQDIIEARNYGNGQALIRVMRSGNPLKFKVDAIDNSAGRICLKMNLIDCQELIWPFPTIHFCNIFDSELVASLFPFFRLQGTVNVVTPGYLVNFIINKSNPINKTEQLDESREKTSTSTV